ncbi:MAG: hypothetical protein J2P21_08965 [Chloracidobacterium sp.]|nr:hypothetical protein [Chloracidobacterium sp.]
MNAQNLLLGALAAGGIILVFPIQGSQTTAAQQKITITSTENLVHVIAATVII